MVFMQLFLARVLCRSQFTLGEYIVVLKISLFYEISCDCL